MVRATSELRRPVAWPVIALVVACARLADAEPDDAKAWRERGNSAMDAERPADAARAYEEAYRLHPEPALLYNLGRAHHALGNYALARDFYVRFDAEAPPELRARVAALPRMLAEVRARVGVLVVQCATPGARVRLGGRVLGAVPLDPAPFVVAGRSELEVEAEGFEPFKQTIDIEGDERTTRVDVVLTRRRAPSAPLSLRSTPPGAFVSVDGRSVGLTPLDARLEAGAHTIELRKSGYRSLRTTIVTDGSKREAHYQLQGEAGVLSRWWFWTGAAVVVAAATTTTVLLVNQQPSAEDGTLAPGQVHLPLGRGL